MNYEQIKDKYLNDPSIRGVGKSALLALDNIDCVKAMHIIKDLEHIIKMKCDEALQVVRCNEQELEMLKEIIASDTLGLLG